MDSLLTSTTWRRGKKRNQKLQTERRTKAAERDKKKGRGKKRNQKLQTERKTKAAERRDKKKGRGKKKTKAANKSCKRKRKQKLQTERRTKAAQKKKILTLMVSVKIRVISFNEKS